MNVVITKDNSIDNNKKELMLTDTTGAAKIYAGVVNDDHLINATYGAYYYELTVTISPETGEDYSQLAGTYYVHIDNTNTRVRLANALDDGKVKADVSGLYATFSVTDGVLSAPKTFKLFVAVTPGKADDEDTLAFTSAANDWSVTIDQAAGDGAVALSQNA